MYFDPITKQVFIYETPISCDNNSQNFTACDPENDEPYVLIPKPALRAFPLLIGPLPVQSATNPNTFTAQEAAIHSNAELTNSFNRVLFTTHSN